MVKITALAAALALAACAAQPSLRAPAGELDDGGYKIPQLSVVHSYTFIVHVDSIADMHAAFDKHMGGQVGHGLTVPHRADPIPLPDGSVATAEIYVCGCDAADWRKFGQTLDHEFAHGEGWPANHPTGWEAPE